MGDITTGYTFKAAEKGISHTKLNLAVNGGVINATFVSGKTALTGSPSKTGTFLLAYDGTSLRKISLASAFFDHDDLLHTRTLATVPLAGDEFMIADSLTTFGVKRITVGNALFGAAEFTSAIAYDDLLSFYDTSGTTIHRIKVGNLFWKLPSRSGAVIATDELPIVNTGGTTAEKVPVSKLASFITPAGVMLPFGGAATPTGWLECTGAAVSRTTYADLFAAIGTTWGAGDGATTFNLPDMRGRTAIGAGTGTWTATFTADHTTEQFTVASNSVLQTGTAVVLTTTGTLPAGTSLATTYYCIRVSSTVIQLATTLANAVAGTALLITDNGSGTHTLTNTLTARTLGDRLGEETHALTPSEMPTHTHGIGAASDRGSGGAGGLVSAAAGISSTSAGSSVTHNNMPPAAVIRWIIHT